MKIQIGKARKKLVKNNTKTFSRNLAKFWSTSHLGQTEVNRILSTRKIDSAQKIFIEENVKDGITRAVSPSLLRNSKAINAAVRSQMKGRAGEVIDIEKIVNLHTKVLVKRLQKRQIKAMRIVARYEHSNAKMLRLAQGMTEGDAKRLVKTHIKNVKDQGKRYANRVFSQSALQVKRRRYKAIAVTETNRVLNDVVRLQIEASGVKGWRVWNAQLDRCPICDALDGKRVRIGQSFDEEPPIHVNCHCSIDADLV